MNTQKVIRCFSDPVRTQRNKIKDTLDLISDLAIKDDPNYVDTLLLLAGLLNKFDHFIDDLDSIEYKDLEKINTN